MIDPLNIIKPEVEEEATNNNENGDDMLHRVVEEILSTKNLDTKTDLNDKMVVALTKADMFAMIYDNEIVAALSNTMKRLRISRNRLGRQELKEMTRNLISYDSTPDEPTIMSKLFKNTKDY